MLSLFDKNRVFSNLREDNSSLTKRSEIKTMVPIMAKEVAAEIATVVVVVVVETIVVVVVVTVVIISPSTLFCNVQALLLLCIYDYHIYIFRFFQEKYNKSLYRSRLPK